jgi:hypothetical protein
VSLVSFLDRAERDVRQERRQNPTLGSAGIRAGELTLCQDTCSQERYDESIHLRVTDAPAYPVHQRVVIDIVEASFDVSFDGPLIRKPILDFTRSIEGPGAQEHPKVLERAVNSSTGAKSIRDGVEVRLEDRLQDALHCCLHDTICDGRYSEGSILPRTTWLRDQHPSHRARLVRLKLQHFAHIVHEAFSPYLSDELRHRDSVHACRTPTAIAGDAMQGAAQRSGIHDEPPELAKDEVQIGPTPVVERALNVPEPILVGLRRRIRGLLRRNPRPTHRLPPFAMCAAFPRSDYYGGSVPRPRRHRTWQLAAPCWARRSDRGSRVH